MLGEFNDWEEFLRPDLQDFASMPRREFRALDSHTRRFLKSELKRFCDRNFEDMTPEALSDLFEDIKVHRGLEIPLHEFDKQYSPIIPDVHKGKPPHSTVVLSLWGMQFQFPEDHLTKNPANYYDTF